MTHRQLEQVCQHLKQYCAPHTGKTCTSTGQRVRGTKRPGAVVVGVWQTYLIVTLLTYSPVRQQEIRQYDVKRTLFREVNHEGQPIYVARNIHHEGEHITGTTRDYCLPSVLTQDLDTWIQVYLPMVKQVVLTLEG